jgi:hypothetical protein
MWRIKLSRGERLFKVLGKSKLRKSLSVPAEVEETPFVENLFTVGINILKEKIQSVSFQNIENNKDAMILVLNDFDIAIANVEKYKGFANRLPLKKKKCFITLLNSARTKRKKLIKKLNISVDLDGRKQKAKKLLLKNTLKKENLEKSDKKWVNFILDAMLDEVSHPKYSDFYIMGHFLNERLSAKSELSYSELMEAARKHLKIIRDKNKYLSSSRGNR